MLRLLIFFTMLAPMATTCGWLLFEGSANNYQILVDCGIN